MEPPSEEFDVDDSDLQSSSHLRPCKQQRRRDESNPSTTTTTTTASAANPSESQTLASRQTANTNPPNVNSSHQIEASSSLCTIPGPAGIVQAAKIYKTRDIQSSVGQEESPMATQEYMRRVVPDEDEDFKRGPWLSATEFMKSDDVFSSVPRAHLGEINKYQKNGKLDQVVAVIKFCAVNELGDFTVTLKDLTGTVSGTISHKVLAEGEFKKGICVGSVLVLHKVSVFSPSRSVHYLNITKRNLVKIFYKDGGSSQKQIFHGVDATPSSDSGLGTPLLRSSFSLKQAEGTSNGIRISSSTNRNQSLHIDDQPAKVNPISKSNNRDTNQRIATNKEILKEANFTESSDNISLKGTDRVWVHVEPAMPMVGSWTIEEAEKLYELDCDF